MLPNCLFVLEFGLGKSQNNMPKVSFRYTSLITLSNVWHIYTNLPIKVQACCPKQLEK